MNFLHPQLPSVLRESCPPRVRPALRDPHEATLWVRLARQSCLTLAGASRVPASDAAPALLAGRRTVRRRYGPFASPAPSCPLTTPSAYPSGPGVCRLPVDGGPTTRLARRSVACRGGQQPVVVLPGGGAPPPP